MIFLGCEEVWYWSWEARCYLAGLGDLNGRVLLLGYQNLVLVLNGTKMGVHFVAIDMFEDLVSLDSSVGFWDVLGI